MKSGHEPQQEAAESRDTVHDFPRPSGANIPGTAPPVSVEAFLGLAGGQAPLLFWSTDAELRLTACSGGARTALALGPISDAVLVAAHRQALQGQAVFCEV